MQLQISGELALAASCCLDSDEDLARRANAASAGAFDWDRFELLLAFHGIAGLAGARLQAVSPGLVPADLARASAASVEELPAGLDTMVGEGGRQLSGGERQLIVLARALLRRPSLLILDEATSALDSDNETAIAQALERLRGDMAILVICHRGELRNLADRVVTLENGRVVAVEHLAKDCN